jgi:hypothetical protein
MIADTTKRGHVAEASGEPEMKWMYRQQKGVTLAWREPVRPPSDWVFDEIALRATNPRQDLQIYSTSRGRDDFSHTGFRLSDRKALFHFAMGRAYSRELTDDERDAHRHYDKAIVYLIVDRHLSQEQRQLVREWLQAEEHGRAIFSRPPDEPRHLVCLESVNGIDGY